MADVIQLAPARAAAGFLQNPVLVFIQTAPDTFEIAVGFRVKFWWGVLLVSTSGECPTCASVRCVVVVVVAGGKLAGARRFGIRAIPSTVPEFQPWLWGSPSR